MGTRQVKPKKIFVILSRLGVLSSLKLPSLPPLTSRSSKDQEHKHEELAVDDMRTLMEVGTGLVRKVFG